MTDRTRYDRTEEEAPLVPLVRETGSRRRPNRPTTDRPTIDRKTTGRSPTNRTRTDRKTTDRPRTGMNPELERELRMLRTQLDRIEATLRDER